MNSLRLDVQLLIARLDDRAGTEKRRETARETDPKDVVASRRYSDALANAIFALNHLRFEIDIKGDYS